MADSLATIRITGIAQLLKDFDTFESKTKALIQAELKASAQIIVRNAKRKAPKDMGALAGGVGYKEVKPTLFEYFSQLNYSQFLEFGTRTKRLVPAEVQKLGIQLFTGRSPGTAKEALKFITAWVKRKGIRFKKGGGRNERVAGNKKPRYSNKTHLSFEETAYLIFRHVMTIGIEAQPFFFKPLLDEVPLLQKRLELIINNAKL